MVRNILVRNFSDVLVLLVLEEKPQAVLPKTSKVDAGMTDAPERDASPRQSTLVQKVAMCCRLLAGGASIHIDFHADRHFDDLRCFPGHFGSPSGETGRTPPF
jgi:hypothetical protein